MKYVVWIVGLLVLMGPGNVRAQAVVDCSVLEERLDRQDRIRGFYGCAMRSQDREAHRRALAVRRCKRGDQVPVT